MIRRGGCVFERLTSSQMSSVTASAAALLDVDVIKFGRYLRYSRKSARVVFDTFKTLMRRRFRGSCTPEKVEDFVDLLHIDSKIRGSLSDRRVHVTVIRSVCGVPLIGSELNKHKFAAAAFDVVRALALDDDNVELVRLALVEQELRQLLSRTGLKRRRQDLFIRDGYKTQVARLESALGYSASARELQTVEGEFLRAHMLSDRAGLLEHTEVNPLRWRVTEGAAWSTALIQWFGSNPDECSIMFGSHAIASRWQRLNFCDVESFIRRESGFNSSIASLDDIVLDQIKIAIPVVYSEQAALTLFEVDEFCVDVESFMLEEVGKL